MPCHLSRPLTVHSHFVVQDVDDFRLFPPAEVMSSFSMMTSRRRRRGAHLPPVSKRYDNNNSERCRNVGRRDYTRNQNRYISRRQLIERPASPDVDRLPIDYLAFGELDQSAAHVTVT